MEVKGQREKENKEEKYKRDTECDRKRDREENRYIKKSRMHNKLLYAIKSVSF